MNPRAKDWVISRCTRASSAKIALNGTTDAAETHFPRLTRPAIPQGADLFRPQRLDRIDRGSSLCGQKRRPQRDRCEHQNHHDEKLSIPLRVDLGN